MRNSSTPEKAVELGTGYCMQNKTAMDTIDVIYLDFCNAFDVVQSNILVAKMEWYF